MTQVVHTLDLKFQNRNDAIAAFLIPYSGGAVLVESGPGSTTEGLKAGLDEHGMKISDVTHVLLSHIHLDHAGAAGWLAQQGAEIYVHPRGAPHLINPERLIISATRIYQDKMHTLWGDFLAVPENQLHIPEDGEKFTIGDLEFTAYFTPGHAEHHIAYGFGNLVFTGDVAGVRMPGCDYVRLPLVPPELHLERWQASIELLLEKNFKRIAPTHFSIYDDAEKHLLDALKAAKTTSLWLEEIMPTNPGNDELGVEFTKWMSKEAEANNISEHDLKTYEIANPLHMSSTALARYWTKFRQPAT
ncbi:MAG: MBL fold metallo-hydrolase [Chloroflexi bacterium]|nr:MBL fold metallo-hydrolase [Chloroflexota bacterium]